MVRFTTHQLKLSAIIWLCAITVLFFLPGTAFPKENWLQKIFFDKWVHAAFFIVLIFLWRFYFPAGKRFNLILLFYALVYGLTVEVVQHFFIINRSFDLGDLIADMFGACAGIWLWIRVYKKNRPL